jgi:hypothetical protein
MRKWIAPVVLVVTLVVAACAREMRADSGSDAKSAPAASPAAVAPPSAPAYREVTIPAGTKLGVRLNTSVASNASRVEDPVAATLIAPLKIGESVVLPAGSELKGYVSSARRSGKVKGRASLGLRFGTLTTRGDSYPIAAQVSRVAPATKAEDAAKIGIPAAGGAGIGALVGGKTGAAAGALIGGGAGTAVVLSTPGKEVSLPHGSVLSLRLQKAVTIRVPAKV